MALGEVGHYAQVWLKFSGNWSGETKKIAGGVLEIHVQHPIGVKPSGADIGATVDPCGEIWFGSEGHRWVLPNGFDSHHFRVR